MMDTLVQHNLIAFLRGLRGLGLVVGTSEETLALQALSHVGFSNESVCKHAIAAVVVKKRDDYFLFDTAWRQFLIWLRMQHTPILPENTLLANVMRMREREKAKKEIIWMGHHLGKKEQDEEVSESETVTFRAGASKTEILQHRDFARLTEAEQEEIYRLSGYIEPLKIKSHRYQKTCHGRDIDFAHTIRNHFRPLGANQILFRKPRRKVQRIVLLCDVSASMDPYSRMFLRFAHVLKMRGVPVEVFVFGTRLSHVTRAFRTADLDETFYQVSLAAPDFSGGTRLSHTLAAFVRTFGKRMLAKKSVVLLCTDGFETGDTDDLTRSVRRLASLSWRLVWLNPHAKGKTYAAEARGPRVLATYADEVIPAYNWFSLLQMWKQLQTEGVHRMVGHNRTRYASNVLVR